jgi:hypothetical protein
VETPFEHPSDVVLVSVEDQVWKFYYIPNLYISFINI